MRLKPIKRTRAEIVAMLLVLASLGEKANSQEMTKYEVIDGKAHVTFEPAHRQYWIGAVDGDGRGYVKTASGWVAARQCQDVDCRLSEGPIKILDGEFTERDLGLMNIVLCYAYRIVNRYTYGNAIMAWRPSGLPETVLGNPAPQAYTQVYGLGYYGSSYSSYDLSLPANPMCRVLYAEFFKSQ